MTNRHGISLVVTIVSVLAACGGGGEASVDALIIIPDAAIDAAVPPDAPPAADLSCLGAALPTTASDPAVLGGSASTINVTAQAIEPVVGADVRAFATDDDHEIAMTTTDMAGAYTLTIPTGGMPVDGYVRGTKAGLRDIYVYPQTPYVASDMGGLLFMLDAQVWGFLSDGEEQAGNGSLVVVVLDCAGIPIAGATVAAEQGGKVVGITAYADSSMGFPLPGSDRETDASGTAYIFDVPPGATTVSATVLGSQLRAHVVGSAAQSTTTTAIVP